ncbi:hypothetical protein SK68_05286 [Serratia marcescens]|nr:hypothetical protein SK68_05286 [Serratia marcescens]KMJ01397.1 hypothetical protein SN03_05250 [Serratia marcescens]
MILVSVKIRNQHVGIITAISPLAVAVQLRCNRCHLNHSRWSQCHSSYSTA